MGSSSKVLLVGATSLIVGIYAISLKNVQGNNFKTAQTDVNRVQTERVVDAAVRLALDNVKVHDGTNATVTGKHAFGGDISYTIQKQSSSRVAMTITVSKSGSTRVLSAIADKVVSKSKKGFRKFHRGDWQLTSIFVKRQG